MCSNAMLTTTGRSARGGRASRPSAAAIANSASVAMAERNASSHSGDRL
jgi:hypothetical protein